MDLQQLRYFQITAQMQHITNAAKVLNISQSALSTTLSRLEKELKVPLFEKQGRNVVLSPYGKHLMHHGQIILNEFDDIFRELKEMQNKQISYTVSIGVSDSNYYGDWLIELYSALPDYKLKLLQMSQSEIQHKLLLGELDFGISPSLAPNENIQSLRLVNDPYILLVSDKNPLFGQQSITAAQLSEVAFISLPPSNQDRLVDIVNHELDMRLNIMFEGYSEMMKAILTVSNGCILTCQHNLQHWISPQETNYSVLDITDLNCRYELYLSWCKHHYLPRPAQFFKDYIISYYQRN